VVYETEPDTRRFILKALRESTGELFKQFYSLNERSLRWRPAADEWCLKDLAGHLRDAERLYLRQIDLIARQREPRLPHEPLDVLPFEQDYREQSLRSLLEEYEAAREDTFWTLRLLDEEDWQRGGTHPYRGRISITDIAREMHEHDLEHLYQAQSLRRSLPSR
jgi:hypothetical protein